MIQTADNNKALPHFDSIALPLPIDYHPTTTTTIVDTKIWYQMLEHMHEHKAKYPNCPKVDRYIKLLKVHYEAWFPKIQTCGCY